MNVHDYRDPDRPDLDLVRFVFTGGHMVLPATFLFTGGVWAVATMGE